MEQLKTHLTVFLIITNIIYSCESPLSCKWDFSKSSWCPSYSTEYTSQWQTQARCLNCPMGMAYHCARILGIDGTFKEQCAVPIECITGTEPRIGLHDGNITCTNCHDPDTFNDYDNKSSSTFSECQFKKTICIKQHHRIECGRTPNISSENRYCRCDARNNYVFSSGQTNEQGCSNSLSMNCSYVPACPSGKERSIKGDSSICLEHCQQGYYRPNDSDDCFTNQYIPDDETTVPSTSSSISLVKTTLQPPVTISKLQDVSPSEHGTNKSFPIGVVVGIAIAIACFVLVVIGWICLKRRGLKCCGYTVCKGSSYNLVPTENSDPIPKPDQVEVKKTTCVHAPKEASSQPAPKPTQQVINDHIASQNNTTNIRRNQEKSKGKHSSDNVSHMNNKHETEGESSSTSSPSIQQQTRVSEKDDAFLNANKTKPPSQCHGDDDNIVDDERVANGDAVTNVGHAIPKPDQVEVKKTACVHAPEEASSQPAPKPTQQVINYHIASQHNTTNIRRNQEKSKGKRSYINRSHMKNKQETEGESSSTSPPLIQQQTRVSEKDDVCLNANKTEPPSHCHGDDDNIVDDGRVTNGDAVTNVGHGQCQESAMRIGQEEATLQSAPQPTQQVINQCISGDQYNTENIGRDQEKSKGKHSSVYVSHMKNKQETEGGASSSNSPLIQQQTRVSEKDDVFLNANQKEPPSHCHDDDDNIVDDDRVGNGDAVTNVWHGQCQESTIGIGHEGMERGKDDVYGQGISKVLDASQIGSSAIPKPDEVEVNKTTCEHAPKAPTSQSAPQPTQQVINQYISGDQYNTENIGRDQEKSKRKHSSVNVSHIDNNQETEGESSSTSYPLIQQQTHLLEEDDAFPNANTKEPPSHCHGDDDNIVDDDRVANRDAVTNAGHGQCQESSMGIGQEGMITLRGKDDMFGQGISKELDKSQLGSSDDHTKDEKDDVKDSEPNASTLSLLEATLPNDRIFHDNRPSDLQRPSGSRRNDSGFGSDDNYKDAKNDDNDDDNFEKQVCLHRLGHTADQLKWVYQQVLQKLFSNILLHMAPISLCDKFTEIELFQYIDIRDMRQKPDDSSKNREILKFVHQGGSEKYIQFKECLDDTKQYNIVEELEKLEAEILNMPETDTDEDKVYEENDDDDDDYESNENSSGNTSSTNNENHYAINEDSRLSPHSNDVGDNEDKPVQENHPFTLEEESPSLSADQSPNTNTQPQYFDEGGANAEQQHRFNEMSEQSVNSDDTIKNDDETMEMRAYNFLQFLHKIATEKNPEEFELEAVKIKQENMDLFKFPFELFLAVSEHHSNLRNCPSDIQAFSSSGIDNSWLFQSISLLLPSSELYQHRLRLAVTVHAVRHRMTYVKHHTQLLEKTHGDLTVDNILSFFSAHLPDNIVANTNKPNTRRTDRELCYCYDHAKRYWQRK